MSGNLWKEEYGAALRWLVTIYATIQTVIAFGKRIAYKVYDFLVFPMTIYKRITAFMALMKLRLFVWRRICLTHLANLTSKFHYYDISSYCLHPLSILSLWTSAINLAIEKSFQLLHQIKNYIIELFISKSINTWRRLSETFCLLFLPIRFAISFVKTKFLIPTLDSTLRALETPSTTGKTHDINCIQMTEEALGGVAATMGFAMDDDEEAQEIKFQLTIKFPKNNNNNNNNNNQRRRNSNVRGKIYEVGHDYNFT